MGHTTCYASTGEPNHHHYPLSKLWSFGSILSGLQKLLSGRDRKYCGSLLRPSCTVLVGIHADLSAMLMTLVIHLPWQDWVQLILPFDGRAREVSFRVSGCSWGRVDRSQTAC